VVRDKSSEWKAIRGSESAARLPMGILAEAVCEPMNRPEGRRSDAPDAVVTRLAVRIGELHDHSWVAADLHNLLLLLSPSDVATLIPILGRFGSGGNSVPIPVVRTSSPPAVRQAVYDLAQRLGKGLVLRVDGVNHLGRSVKVAETIALESGVAAQDIDLIVDAKDLPRYVPLVELHDSFPVIPSCRSWTFLSGTFPGSITDLSPSTLLHTLDRTEWSSYSEQILNLGGRRVPWFGDYATQPAEYQPSAPFRPSPTLRYTTAGGYLVLRGRRDAPEGSTQYIGHARVLQSHPEFGSVVSGDSEAYTRRIASGTCGTGNPETWRVASLQRHTAVACAQEAAVRAAVTSSA
ncbi:MAG: beta family protein, partial [Gemmatimonadaceae bacterium]|nr:beta family protein [Gemmatimonadaceae bacterium]